ncbi:MAG: hypothetical protein ACRDT8_24910, partial [Micromonosporaceae bacterium]
QGAAALAVGGAASHGGVNALSPLLRGENVRGVLVLGLLILGGGLAVWAPFRLRGWPAALCGSLAATVITFVIELQLAPGAGNVLTATATLAAGFALGGVLSASVGAPALARGLTVAGLTAGLTLGMWGAPLTHVLGVAAVVLSGIAARQTPPPGWVPVALAPLAVLLAAVLLGCVLVGGPEGYGFVLFIFLGSAIAGAAAWWLGAPQPRSER